MSNIKELIREKIDAFYTEYKAKFHQNGDSYHLGIIDGLDIAERILDTLPDEPVTTCDQLEPVTDCHELTEAAEAYSRQVSRGNNYRDLTCGFIAGAKWGANHDTTKKVPEDLEEAAIDFADNARKQLFTKDYAISSIADYDHGCIDGFKAGAEWQKRKMMEWAVEGVVYRYESYQRIATAIIVDVPKESLGNKVRIIVLPKED